MQSDSSNRSVRVAFMLPWLALSGGCGLIHKVERGPAPPVTVPDGFSRASAGTRTSSAAWWLAFGDAGLEEAIERAFAGNLTFAQAFTRLDQAKAALDGADAGYWPTITADASVTGSRNVFNFGQSTGGGTISVEQAQYNISLGAAYEVDLWGRIHSLANAADLDYAATQQDLRAVAMTLSAQVAETWFQLAEQIATERLLTEQVERNDTQVELMELRFGQGLASAVDVLQQRQVLAASKTQLPPVQANRQVLQHQLAVLLGLPPGSPLPDVTKTIPSLPPLPSVGVPAGLIEQRPDVRSARLRVVAADYRVGAALAARFPTIRLSASTGFRSFDLAQLFDNWLWNLVAGITGPIFDGGRLAANQRQSEAVLQDRVMGYGQTVLVALQEVEDALVRESHQQDLIRELDLQADAAQRTYEEAYSRFVNGLSEYLPVLTALREVQALERAQIQVRRQLLSHRIQLCRALGGSWTSEPKRPEMLSAKEGTAP